MLLVDNAPMPRGWVHYEVRRHGRIIEVVDEPNLVVAQAGTILAEALTGATGDFVTKFGIGSNLTPPVLGNTVLTNAYLNALIGQPSFPAPGQVAFQFQLQSNEANGSSIGEVGLLTTSGLLFARKVRQALLPKDATISLSGTWTITW